MSGTQRLACIRSTLPLVVAIALTACAVDSDHVRQQPPPTHKSDGAGSRWERGSCRTDPLLRAGRRLCPEYSIESPDPRDVRWVVLAGGPEEVIGSVSDLRQHVIAIDTPERAVNYTELLRRVGVLAQQDYGQVLQLRTSSSGRGGYSVEDARAWGVPEAPQVHQKIDGFDIRRVVVTVPASLTSGVPFSVAEIHESVSRDGTYSGRLVRVLAEGEAAQKFAVLPR